MIQSLIETMYQRNVSLERENGRLILVSEDLVDSDLKEEIRSKKSGLLKRLDEEQLAKEAGLTEALHGQVYFYRYGMNAYIYLERHENGKASVWRESYKPGAVRSHKVKMMATRVSFERAVKEAWGFIEWLQSKKGLV